MTARGERQWAVGGSADHELIGRMYDAYNGRDLEALIALVSPDVNWPDDDNRLHGRAAVGDYWSRQWARIRTHDEVLGLADLGPGRTAVRISQVVRDLNGAIVSTGAFLHIFELRDGLVERMDVRKT